MTRRSFLISIRGSLWFTPALFLLAAIGLALGLVQVDHMLTADMTRAWPERLTAGPEAARQILTTITGSTITVIGVVFSITIVSLSLASNQFSPRVLRSFMRDRVNQVVLGVLVGVFIYGLLVLQSVRSDSVVFTPQVALWGGILLALVAVGFLIAFLHHTAVSIQASEIVARLADETVAALRSTRAAQRERGNRPPAPASGGDTAEERSAIPSPSTGYIQDVALDPLEQIAQRLDVVLHVEHGVGDFVVARQPLVRVRGARAPDPRAIAAIQDCFGLNTYRTIDQDPAFGMRQIVDIALKALSPGINDTTTAIHCIDYLGSILHEVAEGADDPAGPAADPPSTRVWIKRPSPSHYLDLALHEIRQNARGNVAVLLRLVRTLRQLLSQRAAGEVLQPGLKHLQLLREASGEVSCAADRCIVTDSLDQALRMIRTS